MAIPKPLRPEYSCTLASSGKRVKFHPFTVREEKVLTLAAESQDLEEISNAIANVLRSCVTTPADFDPYKLGLFDIEFLFLKARAKSIGEVIELRVTDPNDETYSVDYELDVDKVKLEKTEGHTQLVDISDEVKIKMNYPGLEFFAEGLKIDDLAESIKTVARCVGQIVVGEEVYNRADMSDEEIVEWLESQNQQQFVKLISFFQTMPRLRHVIKQRNPKTKETFEVVLEGLTDFF